MKIDDSKHEESLERKMIKRKIELKRQTIWILENEIEELKKKLNDNLDE